MVRPCECNILLYTEKCSNIQGSLYFKTLLELYFMFYIEFSIEKWDRVVKGLNCAKMCYAMLYIVINGREGIQTIMIALSRSGAIKGYLNIFIVLFD